MSNFYIPNSGVVHDIGGVYADGSKIGQFEQIVVRHDHGNPHGNPHDCCQPCIVDENGVAYLTDANDCFIIPRASGVSGLTYVVVTGCLTGSGTSASPISIILDPNGNIVCGANGLAVSGIVSASTVTVSGCLSGDGSVSSPIYINLDPNSIIQCGPSGLTINGELGCCPSGINVSINGNNLTTTLTLNDGTTLSDSVLLPSGSVSMISTSGCLTGDGVGTPLQISLSSDGNIICTSDGLAVSGLLSSVSVGSCLSGDGTSGNPLTLTIDPNGNIACGVSGIGLTGNIPCCTSGIDLSYSGSTLSLTLTDYAGNSLVDTTTITSISTVSTSGCLVGDGSSSSPIYINFDSSTLECGPSGLTVITDTSCCVSGITTDVSGFTLTTSVTLNSGDSYTDTANILVPNVSGVSVDIDGTTLTVTVLDLLGNSFVDSAILPAGSGGISSVVTSGCISGDGTADSPIVITIDPSSRLSCGISGLTITDDTGCCNSGVSLTVVGISGFITITDNNGNTVSDSVTLPLVEVGSCLTGDGFLTPIELVIDVNSNITCGISGLTLQGNIPCCTSGVELDYSGSTLSLTLTDFAGNSIIDTTTIDVISSVVTSGCISGDGTTESPIIINIDPSSRLSCGISGLTISSDTSCCNSGVILTTVGGSGINVVITTNNGDSVTSTTYLPDVNVEGCLTGNGYSIPISVLLDPSGGIRCGPNGLTLAGSGNDFVISTEDGPCISGAAAPVTPAPLPVQGTVQVEYFDDCINIWAYDGGWIKDKTVVLDQCCIADVSLTLNGNNLTSTVTDEAGNVFSDTIMLPSGTSTTVSTSGCLFGDGFNEPIQIRVDSQTIICTENGLAISGIFIDSVVSSGCILGNGTSANPLYINVDGSTIICGSNGLEVSGMLSFVSTTGCLEGDGTLGNPLSITVSPLGNITCGSSGLELTGNIPCCTSGMELDYSGSTLTLTLTDFGGNALVDTTTISVISSVSTSGCITGDGTAENPIIVSLNPNYLICGSSGIEVVANTDCCTSGVVLSTVGGSGISIVITDNNGDTFTDSVILPPIGTSGCISGDGYGSPITISINPDGGLSCSFSGLGLSDADGCCPSGIELSVSGNSLITTLTTNNGTTVTDNVNILLPNVSGFSLEISGSNILVGTVLDYLGNSFIDSVVLPVSSASGISSVVVSGCLSGDGTVDSPIYLPLNTNYIVCGVSGLETVPNVDCCTSGVALSIVSSSGLNIVITDNDGTTVESLISLPNIRVSGCLTGNGYGIPIQITVDPSGGLQCGPNGLRIEGDGTCLSISTEDVNCSAASGNSPVNPTPFAEENTVQVELLNDCIKVWVHNGTSWQLDKEVDFGSGPSGGLTSVSVQGCITGNGDDTPLDLDIDPDGGIVCGGNGLALADACYVSGLTLSINGATLTTSVLDYRGCTVSDSLLLPFTSGTGGGISSIETSGCISGDGTTENPVYLNVAADGGLTCGVGGLQLADACFVSGLTLAVNGSNLTTTIIDFRGCSYSDTVMLPSGTGTTIMVSGCLTGDGVNDPITLVLNADYLVCGDNGLEVVPDTSCCTSGITAELVGVSGITLTIEDNSGNTKTTTVYLPPIDTSGCIIGNGYSSPIRISIDSDGGLVCGSNGISLENSCFISGVTLDVTDSTLTTTVKDFRGCSVSHSVELPSTSTAVSGLTSVFTSGCISGNGDDIPVELVVDPNGGLVCNGSDGVALLTNGVIYMGQVGPVQEDDVIANQARFTVPSGLSLEIYRAHATLGVPSGSGINIEFHSSAGSAGVPGSTTLEDTLLFPKNTIYKTWDGIIGSTFLGPTHLQERVNLADGVGQDLSIQIFYRIYG